MASAYECRWKLKTGTQAWNNPDWTGNWDLIEHEVAMYTIADGCGAGDGPSHIHCITISLRDTTSETAVTTSKESLLVKCFVWKVQNTISVRDTTSVTPSASSKLDVPEAVVGLWSPWKSTSEFWNICTNTREIKSSKDSGSIQNSWLTREAQKQKYWMAYSPGQIVAWDTNLNKKRYK